MIRVNKINARKKGFFVINTVNMLCKEKKGEGRRRK